MGSTNQRFPLRFLHATPTPGNQAHKSVKGCAFMCRMPQAAYFLTHTDPVTLGEYALGLVAAYYLAPPLLKASFGALRGYAGGCGTNGIPPPLPPDWAWAPIL